LNEQHLRTQWQQKVFSKLLGLQYKIVYKKKDQIIGWKGMKTSIHNFVKSSSYLSAG
jgi:hypothetical protein